MTDRQIGLTDRQIGLTDRQIGLTDRQIAPAVHVDLGIVAVADFTKIVADDDVPEIVVEVPFSQTAA